MSQYIHRRNTPNGPRYRIWGTSTDSYLTEDMTREEAEIYLRMEFRLESEPALREGTLKLLEQELEVRFARADATGTSCRSSLRSMDGWDTERCTHCGTFHHEFDLRLNDGLCRHCGETPGDRAHRPQCMQ